MRIEGDMEICRNCSGRARQADKSGRFFCDKICQADFYTQIPDMKRMNIGPKVTPEDGTKKKKGKDRDGVKKPTKKEKNEEKNEDEDDAMKMFEFIIDMDLEERRNRVEEVLGKERRKAMKGFAKKKLTKKELEALKLAYKIGKEDDYSELVDTVSGYDDADFITKLYPNFHNGVHVDQYFGSESD